MNQRSERGWLLGIFVLAVALRWVAFSGVFGSDDLIFSKLATKMASGSWKAVDPSDSPIMKNRLGFIVPVAASIKWIGVNEWGISFYPFLVSILGVLLAFVAGKSFFGPKAGLIAALLQALLPIDLQLASQCLSDLPAAFYSSIGIFLMYRACVSASRQKILSALAGMSFGISYLNRENVVYMIPLAAGMLYWAWRLGRKNVIFFFIAAFGAVGLLEATYYHCFTGDAFYRYHVTENVYFARYSDPSAKFDPSRPTHGFFFFPKRSEFTGSSAQYFMILAKRIFKEGPQQIFMSWDYIYIPLVAAIGAFYAGFRRLKPFYFPVIWFIWSVAVYNFGSSSLKEYQPLAVAPRYFYPLVFPAILLTGGFLDRLFSRGSILDSDWRKERFFWGTLLGGLMCCVFSLAFISTLRSVPYGQFEKKVSKVLKPSDLIYTDSKSPDTLEFFWGYPSKMNFFEFSKQSSESIPEGAYILINENKLAYLYGYYRKSYPEFYGKIPLDWKVILEIPGKGAVYKKGSV